MIRGLDAENKSYTCRNNGPRLWLNCLFLPSHHGDKVKVPSMRGCELASKEVQPPGWDVARDGDLLRKWALNLMLLSVSTRKQRCSFACSVEPIRSSIEDAPGRARRPSSKTSDACLPNFNSECDNAV